MSEERLEELALFYAHKGPQGSDLSDLAHAVEVLLPVLVAAHEYTFDMLFPVQDPRKSEALYQAVANALAVIELSKSP